MKKYYAILIFYLLTLLVIAIFNFRISLILLSVTIICAISFLTKRIIYLFFPLLFIFFNNYLGGEVIAHIPLRYIVLFISIYLIFIVLLVRKNNIEIKFFNKFSFFLFLYLTLQSLFYFFFTEYNKISFLFIIYNFLVILIFYLVIQDKQDFVIFMHMLVISAFAQALIGIGELISGHTIYYEKWAGVRQRDGILRIGSTAGDPNFLCFYLVPIVPIIGFFVSEIKSIFLKTFYFLVGLTILFVIVITNSRIGLISLFMLVGIFVFKKTKFNIILKITVFFIPIFLLVIDYIPKLNFNFSDASFQARFYTQLVGLKLFLSNPLIGIGLDNFTNYSDKILWSSYRVYMEMAPTTMNTYMQIIVEGGILGFIIFLLNIIGIIKGIQVIAVTYSKNFAFWFTLSIISWIIIAFTLDGLFTPLLWIFSIVPFVILKTNKKENSL